MTRLTKTLFAVTICAAAPAFAQENPSQTQQSWETDNVTVERTLEQNDGQTSGTLEVQTENGNGGTRSFDRGYDAENQSASRSSQTSTNSGQTFSSADSVGCNGSGTCERKRSATGPEGQSVSSGRVVSADENGLSSTTTQTGPNGESVTRARNVAQTETGVTRSAGITGPQNSASTQGTFGYTAENGFERSASSVGPQGNTSSSTGSFQCINSTCERTASQNGFGGQSRSVNNRTSLGEYGVVQNERNVTAPNGQTRTQSRVGRARRRPR